MVVRLRLEAMGMKNAYLAVHSLQPEAPNHKTQEELSLNQETIDFLSHLTLTLGHIYIPRSGMVGGILHTIEIVLSSVLNSLSF